VRSCTSRLEIRYVEYAGRELGLSLQLLTSYRLVYPSHHGPVVLSDTQMSPEELLGAGRTVGETYVANQHVSYPLDYRQVNPANAAIRSAYARWLEAGCPLESVPVPAGRYLPLYRSDSEVLTAIGRACRAAHLLYPYRAYTFRSLVRQGLQSESTLPDRLAVLDELVGLVLSQASLTACVHALRWDEERMRRHPSYHVGERYGTGISAV
jgi:hypothetical protein